MAELWPIERRVLAYLDGKGQGHRETVVTELASADSRIGWRRDRHRVGVKGSNGATPLIMASWCRRLIRAGWVEQVDRDGFYQCHRITALGRVAFRDGRELEC